MSEILTPAEAQKVLDVSYSGLMFLIRIGRLPVHLTRSGRKLFDASEVSALAEERASARAVRSQRDVMAEESVCSR